LTARPLDTDSESAPLGSTIRGALLVEALDLRDGPARRRTNTGIARRPSVSLAAVDGCFVGDAGKAESGSARAGRPMGPIDLPDSRT
jgi:hypothetical protein